MSNTALASNADSSFGPFRAWTDWAGMIASIGCAIHCAAMPLAIGYLPLLGLEWLAGHVFHQVMAIGCLGLAALAFVPGWKRHGSLAPALYGIAGVSLLSFAAFALGENCCPSAAVSAATQHNDTSCTDDTCAFCEADTTASEQQVSSAVGLGGLIGPLLTPLGGVLLVMGHVVNHRKSCQCRVDGCCLSTSPGREA